MVTSLNFKQTKGIKVKPHFPSIKKRERHYKGEKQNNWNGFVNFVALLDHLQYVTTKDAMGCMVSMW